MSKNYFNEYSIAKGIGIILMVVGHATFALSGYAKYLNSFIYTFHMPLFFVLSGMCFNKIYFATPLVYIKKRWYRLYVPYIKYSILFLLLHNVFFNIGIYNSVHGYESTVFYEYSYHEIIDRMMCIVLFMVGEETPLVGLWFLKDLLLASAIFVLLYRFWKDNTLIGNTLILLITSFLFLRFSPLSQINVGRMVLGLFYLYLGFNLKKVENRLYDKSPLQVMGGGNCNIVFFYTFL